MGLFENFPYANFHELNLDWILHKLKELETEITNFVAINSVKYANPIIWDITSQYETNTVVLDKSGNAYLSVQPVPAGVSLDREDYWTKIGNFSALWDSVRSSITPYDEQHSTTASVNHKAGEWVWVENDLLLITKDITAGDKYVDGGNCKKTNVHDLFAMLGDTITNEVNTLSGKLEDEIAAREASVTAEAKARAEADTALETKINQEIAPLKIKAWVTPLEFGAVADGVTDCTTQVQAALNSGTPVFMPKNIVYHPEQLVFPKNCILGDMHNDGRLYWRMVGDEGGAVNEFIFQSPYHSAVIVDTAPDIIKGDNIKPDQDTDGPSFNLRYNNKSVWQIRNIHKAGDTLAFEGQESGTRYNLPMVLGRNGVRVGFVTGNYSMENPEYTLTVHGTIGQRNYNQATKIIKITDDAQLKNVVTTYELSANTNGFGIYDRTSGTKRIANMTNTGILRLLAVGGGASAADIKALDVTSYDVGIMIFNTTAGKPVWLKSYKPVVWVYADGTAME